MPDYSFACDILNDVYHNGPDWRDRNGSGMVRTAREDSKRYYHRHVIRKFVPKDTDATIVGSLAHSFLFDTEERFKLEFVQEPEGTERRSKKGKAAWAEFVEYAEQNRLTIFNADQLKRGKGIADSVREHPLCQELLFRGRTFVTEAGFRWDDPEFGVPCKVKWDYLSLDNDEILVVDLKSVTTTEFRNWGSVAARRGYHVQAAHYQEAAREATGWSAPDWRHIFLVVDSEFPHSPAIWPTPAKTLIEGERQRREGLVKIRRGLDTGNWTDPISERFNMFTLPESYLRREEEPQCEFPSWL